MAKKKKGPSPDFPTALKFILPIAAVILLAFVLWPKQQQTVVESITTERELPKQNFQSHLDAPPPPPRNTNAVVPTPSGPSPLAMPEFPPGDGPFDPREPFTGQVLRFNLVPIENAQVTAYLFTRGVYTRGPDYPAVVGETKTNAEGFYRLPTTNIQKDQTYAVRAEAEGYESQIFIYHAGEGLTDHLRTTFRLSEGASIEGYVIDLEEKPVPAAEIGSLILTVQPPSGDMHFGPYPSTYTTADAEGRWTLPGINVDMIPVPIPARATGYADGVSEPAEAGDDEVEIVLARRESSIHGTVTLAEGTPAHGAAVELVGPSGNVSGAKPRVLTAIAGEDGAYAFPDLQSGRYAIKATRRFDNTLETKATVTRDVVLLRNHDLTVDLVLPRPAQIVGRFVDVETGDGVPGVVLVSQTAEVEQRSREHQVQSDEQGNFTVDIFVEERTEGIPYRVPLLFPSPWLLPAEQPKQNPDFRITADGLDMLALKPGVKTEVEIALLGGGVLKGRVVEPDGATPGAELPLFYHGDNFWGSIVTDAQGFFELGVPTDREFIVEVASELGILAKTIRFEKDKELILVLEKYATVAGRVTRDDEGAVAALVVKVNRDPSPGAPLKAIRFTEEAETDAEGNYLAINIAPGRRSVSLDSHPIVEAVPPAPIPVNLAPGEERTGVDFNLKTAMVIEGYVQDEAGKPIDDASIFVSHLSVTLPTDAKGYFRIDGLESGKPVTEITASHAHYTEQSKRNVLPGGEPVTFRLERKGALEIVATDAAGTPQTNYVLQLFREDVGPAGPIMAMADEATVTHASGIHRFDTLKRGRYRAEVAEIGRDSNFTGRKGQSEFSFDPKDGPRRIAIALKDGIIVRGLVVEAGSNAPVGDATVQLLSPPVALSAFYQFTGPPYAQRLELVTDAAGIFAIGPLQAGKYQFEVTRRNLMSGLVEVTVSEDDPNIQIELRRAPRLYGVVLDEEGQPARNVTLWFSMDGGPPRGEPVVTTDGTYDRYLDAPGSWTVIATAERGGASLSQVVQVAEGEERELDLDFGKRVKLTGEVFVDGSPWDGRLPIMLRSSAGDQTFLEPVPGESGQYTATIAPGSITPHVEVARAQIPISDPFVLGEQKEAKQNFVIHLSSLDLVIAAEEGTVFTGGQFTLWRRVAGREVQVLNNWPLDRPSFQLQLPEGTYRAALYRDSTEVGISDWIEIRGGAGNQLMIPVY